MGNNMINELGDSWRNVAMKLASFTNEQLLDELKYRGLNVVDVEKEHSEIDRLWESEYGNGEQYCHKQSFSWGFQKGADWRTRNLMG